MVTRGMNYEGIWYEVCGIKCDLSPDQIMIMFFNSGSTIEGDYVILTPTAKVTSGIDFVPPLSTK